MIWNPFFVKSEKLSGSLICLIGGTVLAVSRALVGKVSQFLFEQGLSRAGAVAPIRTRKPAADEICESAATSTPT